MTATTIYQLSIPAICSILLAVNIILAPRNPYTQKNNPFECGFLSFLWQNRVQFSISFFLFALLFLLFDLEVLLVYPYFLSSYTNDIYGLIIMVMFLILLVIGFGFELSKKALKIDSRQTKLAFIDLDQYYKNSYVNLSCLRNNLYRLYNYLHYIVNTSCNYIRYTINIVRIYLRYIIDILGIELSYIIGIAYINLRYIINIIHINLGYIIGIVRIKVHYTLYSFYDKLYNCVLSYGPKSMFASAVCGSNAWRFSESAINNYTNYENWWKSTTTSLLFVVILIIVSLLYINWESMYESLINCYYNRAKILNEKKHVLKKVMLNIPTYTMTFIKTIFCLTCCLAVIIHIILGICPVLLCTLADFFSLHNMSIMLNDLTKSKLIYCLSGSPEEERTPTSNSPRSTPGQSESQSQSTDNTVMPQAREPDSDSWARSLRETHDAPGWAQGYYSPELGTRGAGEPDPNYWTEYDVVDEFQSISAIKQHDEHKVSEHIKNVRRQLYGTEDVERLTPPQQENESRLRNAISQHLNTYYSEWESQIRKEHGKGIEFRRALGLNRKGGPSSRYIDP